MRQKHHTIDYGKKMTVQELHIKAIELADNAFIFKFKGELENAIKLFSEAFQLERQAALLAKEQNIGEPTISVLLKSAASLAINANELNEAEKLICLALYGEPPHEIAEELRNLLEELYFQRNLIK
jgi:tetratricopeptide (TPR) repeat protein